MIFKFIGHLWWFFGDKIKGYFFPWFVRTFYFNAKGNCPYCGTISNIILKCGCHTHVSCMVENGYGNYCIKCMRDNVLIDDRIYNELYKLKNGEN